MVALPLIIFGSIFVVIANFPFLDKMIGEDAFTAYQNALGPASAATLSIMGTFVIIGIGYKLTERYGGEAIYGGVVALDRKSTRLNSSHVAISYAVFCLKKKTHET